MNVIYHMQHSLRLPYAHARCKKKYDNEFAKVQFSSGHYLHANTHRACAYAGLLYIQQH